MTLSAVPDGSTVLPTDDIQILLNCANIWDKAYTTLAELLSDTTTLLAVISSNNAIDYMVRSTTWASGATSDSTAMTYIGLNNYASNTLLSDSTWCNAICNSAYFESVLNVKVPTMTSNTTPSGEAFANSEYNIQYSAYKAFDGSLVDGMGEWASVDASVSWVAYDFETPVKVYKWGTYSRYATTQTYKIQGSSDRSTWVDESTQHSGLSNNAWHYFVADVSNSAYRYHRLYMENTNIHYTNLKELRFYGRKDV